MQEVAVYMAHKFIGFGTAGIFLLAMPIFLIGASKNKDVKDYMLTKENILKMREKEKDLGKKSDAK